MLDTWTVATRNCGIFFCKEKVQLISPHLQSMTTTWKVEKNWRNFHKKKNNPHEKCRVYRILHPKLHKMDECLSKSNTDAGDKNYRISATLHVAIVEFSKQFFRLYRSSDSEVIYKKGDPKSFAKFTGKNLC